ncbi:MAG: transposase [Oligoflexia bacterium]|nr:transposase [Oligoflexia bacterium]
MVLFRQIFFQINNRSQKRCSKGIQFNYKKTRCLSSLNAFDQFVFNYGFELRNGSRHSSFGAVQMIQDIFKKIPVELKRFFRADSAYANMDIYNALLILQVSFAIALTEISYMPLLEKYGDNINIGFKRNSRLRT